MTEPTPPADKTSLAGAIVLLVALASILLPIVLVAIFRTPAATTATACGSPQAPLTETTGTLRQAGADFYLVDDSGWHLVRSRCASKSHDVCTPAIRQDEAWLASHVGETASAHRCPSGVIDYTVAGRTFHR